MNITIPFQNLQDIHGPAYNGLHCSLSRACETGVFLRGDQTANFERRWAEYCGQEYCVALKNGTDALTLIAAALRLESIEVPAITCWYTAEGLHRGGCEVIPVDVDRSTGKLLRPHDGAVCVPLYGSRPSPEESYNCRIFDAAQAHGWKPPAHAIVAWSFYPTKTLGALGDAGAVTTNDKHLADEIRMLAGRDDQYRDRRQIVSRIDEVQAGFLDAKLSDLNHHIEAKQQIAEWYRERLAGVEGCNPIYEPADTSVYAMAIHARRRNDLKAWLKRNGIESKIHYPVPLHHHDAPWNRIVSPVLPNSEQWCDRVLSLPCYIGMPRNSVAYICDTIQLFYEVNPE